MAKRKLRPVHPGEILSEEFMNPLGLSMNKMATDLRVPVTRIADIVNEKRGITAETALRFARYFNNSPIFWMNLQPVMNWKLLRTRSPPKSSATCNHSRPQVLADKPALRKFGFLCVLCASCPPSAVSLFSVFPFWNKLTID